MARAAVDKTQSEGGAIFQNEIAPTFVVPMGAWLDRTPKVTIDAWKNHRIVYLGHLVERQGVSTLIEAVSILTKKGIKVTADIIGTGPEEEKLKAQAQALKIDKLITFHGFVKDHKEVEHILASGTLAVAPYVKDEVNFVQFTDAGKLKAYLGAYLPIVLNDVPNNAHELSQAGAAIISHDSAIGFADALSVWLTDQKSWQNAHKAAVKVAKEFDWENLLKKALFSIGFDD